MQAEATASAPLRRRSVRGPLLAGLAVLLIVILAIGYLVLSARTADANTADAERALKSVFDHQAMVDKAIADYIHISVPDDPKAALDLANRDLSETQQTLKTVRADQAALKSAQNGLQSNPLTLTHQDALGKERRLTEAAGGALVYANQALVDASVQLNALQPLMDGIMDGNSMLAKAKANDLAGALAVYATAQQKLQTALNRSQRSEVPAEFGMMASFLKQTLEALNLAVKALQTHDVAALNKANNDLSNLGQQAATLKALFDTVDARNAALFKPLEDGYHSSLQQARA